MKVLLAVRAVAALRALVGLGLTVATEPVLRTTVRHEEPGGSLVLFARTVGIRDLIFGLGSLLAARTGDSDELRRWLALWLASDAADILAGATAVRHVGRSGAAAAALAPAPFAAFGVWALRRLGGAQESGFTG